MKRLHHDRTKKKKRNCRNTTTIPNTTSSWLPDDLWHIIFDIVLNSNRPLWQHPSLVGTVTARAYGDQRHHYFCMTRLVCTAWRSLCSARLTHMTWSMMSRFVMRCNADQLLRLFPAVNHLDWSPVRYDHYVHSPTLNLTRYSEQLTSLVTLRFGFTEFTERHSKTPRFQQMTRLRALWIDARDSAYDIHWCTRSIEKSGIALPTASLLELRLDSLFASPAYTERLIQSLTTLRSLTLTGRATRISDASYRDLTTLTCLDLRCEHLESVIGGGTLQICHLTRLTNLTSLRLLFVSERSPPDQLFDTLTAEVVTYVPSVMTSDQQQHHIVQWMQPEVASSLSFSLTPFPSLV